MNWELHATDGTNQTSLVNVSIFHHEIIINNYYYKVPHVLFSFFLFLFLIPLHLSYSKTTSIYRSCIANGEFGFCFVGPDQSEFLALFS